MATGFFAVFDDIASLLDDAKMLSITGTLAMLLVAGGIYVHNIHALHEFLHIMPDILGELITGVVVGVIVLAMVKIAMKIKLNFSHS